MNRAIRLLIDGSRFDTWESGEITRDLNDFAGTFSFNFRDNFRSLNTFIYSSYVPPIYQLRPGAQVEIFIDEELVLLGFIENVCPSIDDGQALVCISGKDKAGDLIDCAAAPDGPAEFHNVTLEEAAKRIAEPYGLKVRSEIDAGETFSRYSMDTGETGLSALEKGARQRQALLLSDGVGGLVITRTGGNRAPADLILPGNVLRSNGSFTYRNRYSKIIVRGQHEKSAGKRASVAPLIVDGAPLKLEERQTAAGTNTSIERAGTSAIGVVVDDEVTRYRPKVYLARTKSTEDDCCREAEWRLRTSRGQADEINYTVHGFRANGRLWRINELVYVSDAFQLVERDMLVSRVSFREDGEGGRTSEITVTSPEAFDDRPVKNRRKNKKTKKRKQQPLINTAEPL